MKNSLFVVFTALVVITLFYSVSAQDKTNNKYAGSASISTTLRTEPIGVISNLAEPSTPSSALSDIADNSSSSAAEPNALPVPISTLPKPVVRSCDSPTSSVQWTSLLKGSMSYLAVMHSFRLGTEAGTREALNNSVVGGYFKSLGAMHGWSDGDGYYENYLGHPIEGAVSGYIWVHHDPRYRVVQFGADRDYWMSRLRAYAFAWAFSEQFEIGPISEASIGQIQRYCCQRLCRPCDNA